MTPDDLHRSSPSASRCANHSSLITHPQSLIPLAGAHRELTECFAMREAVAAQLQLLTAQPALYEPVMEEIRQMQAQMQAQMMGQ
eukprot:4705899-Prymnesium_polylepis.1